MSDVQTGCLLKCLAQARESFLALARGLEAHACVVQVKTGMDARVYVGGACVECFVEAELETGNFVCWWIDIREVDTDWVVEPSLFIQHGGGQDALTELPRHSIPSDAEFCSVLALSVTELTRSPEQVLKAALIWKQ